MSTLVVISHLQLFEFKGGRHGGAGVSAVASQQEGRRFKTSLVLGLGPFCVEFACSPRVCVGFHRVLRLPPTVQKHAEVNWRL